MKAFIQAGRGGGWVVTTASGGHFSGFGSRSWAERFAETMGFQIVEA